MPISGTWIAVSIWSPMSLIGNIPIMIGRISPLPMCRCLLRYWRHWRDIKWRANGQWFGMKVSLIMHHAGRLWSGVYSVWMHLNWREMLWFMAISFICAATCLEMQIWKRRWHIIWKWKGKASKLGIYRLWICSKRESNIITIIRTTMRNGKDLFNLFSMNLRSKI